MPQSTDTHQTDIESAATKNDNDAVIELDDEKGTVLREGDILADARTDEKLVVLGYSEKHGSIEYYSNYEREEGLHDPEFIPSCFDAVFRTVDGNTEVISLSKV
jgi:hypothetical protein